MENSMKKCMKICEAICFALTMVVIILSARNERVLAIIGFFTVLKVMFSVLSKNHIEKKIPYVLACVVFALAHLAVVILP